MRKLDPTRVLGTGTALAALLMMGPGTTQGTVILSDSFNRTLGNADAGNPPLVSDWGANDNALGGSASATYTVSNPGGDFDVELVNGDQGEIAFGRTILPVNLATPAAIAARTRLNPGSLTPGEPPSVATATRLPSAAQRTRVSAIARSLCS